MFIAPIAVGWYIEPMKAEAANLVGYMQEDQDGDGLLPADPAERERLMEALPTANTLLLGLAIKRLVKVERRVAALYIGIEVAIGVIVGMLFWQAIKACWFVGACHWGWL